MRPCWSRPVLFLDLPDKNLSLTYSTRTQKGIANNTETDRHTDTEREKERERDDPSISKIDFERKLDSKRRTVRKMTTVTSVLDAKDHLYAADGGFMLFETTEDKVKAKLEACPTWYLRFNTTSEAPGSRMEGTYTHAHTHTHTRTHTHTHRWEERRVGRMGGGYFGGLRSNRVRRQRRYYCQPR